MATGHFTEWRDFIEAEIDFNEHFLRRWMNLNRTRDNERLNMNRTWSIHDWRIFNENPSTTTLITRQTRGNHLMGQQLNHRTRCMNQMVIELTIIDSQWSHFDKCFDNVSIHLNSTIRISVQEMSECHQDGMMQYCSVSADFLLLLFYFLFSPHLSGFIFFSSNPQFRATESYNQWTNWVSHKVSIDNFFLSHRNDSDSYQFLQILDCIWSIFALSLWDHLSSCFVQF